MSFDELKKAINRRESVKLWAVIFGKYDEYVRVYATKNSPLKNYWANVIEPEVQRYCGEHWGENPRSPLHPIGHELLKRNGLL